MFSWLKWGKPPHPMADLEKVRERIAALPSHDPATALDKVSSWLDSIDHIPKFSLRQRLELIDLLDKAANAHWRKLAQEYISAPYLHGADEDRLSNASFGFWKMLGAAYLRCIEKFGVEEAATEGVREDLALIAGRALRASSLQLKWTFLRYGQVEKRIWRDLGSTYLFAERQGFAAVRAEIYPAPRGQSSAQEELLRALMLVMVSPHNLVPLKQHIAERVIGHFGSRFVLQSGPAPGCGFSFDLAMAAPPAQLQKETAAGSTVRFFGAGEAGRGLTDLMQEIIAKDGIPRDVNLGGEFDRETVLSVLAHLDRYWKDTPPARRAERSEFVTRVTVVPGFPNILRCLELVANGAPLDPGNFPEQESWITANRSDDGFGVLVPAEKESFEYDPLTGERIGTGDWLRIGRLVALSEENARTWKLGLIRRITHEASGQRYVGIELLEGMAIVIKLLNASGPRVGEPERRRAAVLLANAMDRNDEALVLMRAGHFAKTQALSMQIEDQRYLLMPIALVEGGEDFDCARFKMLPA